MAEPDAVADDLPRGALLMVVSALLFAAMGEAVKMASAHLSNAMVVFFRNAFGLLALSPWLLRLGAKGLRTAAWREHLVRGLAGRASACSVPPPSRPSPPPSSPPLPRSACGV
jgi:drug/metabolite transporter (DMT)-like permease